MVTGEIKNRIDSIWDTFWTGGITNSITILEQMTYLFFMKMLDDAQIKKEAAANLLGGTITNPVFKDGAWHNPDTDRDVPYSNLRWHNFVNFEAERMFQTISNDAFIFIKNLNEGKESAYSRFMENATFLIPNPRTLVKIVEGVDKLDMNNRDTMGDVYEYVLGKMAASGNNGQFRTPRHIIRMMVELMQPTLKDTICDPAMGSAGFIVESAKYITEHYKSELLKKENADHYKNSMLHGFDTDQTMLRIGAMNLMLHGVENPDIRYLDSLSTDNTDENRYSLCLANPPFAGSIDNEAVSKSLLAITKTKKTELLFVALFTRMLTVGGRCASIVPDGVLFGNSSGHKALRKELIDHQRLQAVISMPSGVFQPYSGVSTAILVFTKTNAGGTYKLTGGYAAQNIQGHWWTYLLLNSPTLYASPYVVATPQGYTKHYYAGNERIASRIGGGGLVGIAQTVVNMEDLSGDVWAGEMQPIWDEVEMNEYFVNKQEYIRNHLTDVMMCADEDPIMDEDLLSALRDYWRYEPEDGSTAFEPDCYWYHPDHLGSSSWITYTDGTAVQHLHYLPWGEDFVDQRSTSWNAMYTFSAKEKDTETGYSYFGSRYYSSDLSIWLSVDPLSDKYPSMSPYAYCANNPIKLIDPNGEGWYLPENSSKPEWDKDINSTNIPENAKYLGLTTNWFDSDNSGCYYHGDEHGNVTKNCVEGPVITPLTTNNRAPWMHVAESQIGVLEIPKGSNSGPEVNEYLASANLDPGNSWCASFVNWCLKQSGYEGAGGSGSSYTSFGSPVSKENPKYGSIACFNTGHVGFYAGQTKDGNYIIIHGNWSDGVRKSDYIKPDEIKCFRFPAKYKK